MNTITARKAKARFINLVDETVESHTPILITSRRGDAVLISMDNWSAIQESLYLLSVPGLRESIDAGRKEPLSKSKKKINWSHYE